MRRSLLLGCAALALLAAGCDSADRPAPIALPRAVPLPPGSRAVVIVMENKEHDQVLGSGGAPYVDSLARRYASLQSMYAIRHPSLPNYLAMTGGSTFGITTDCTGCSVSGPSIADSLEGAGRSWKAYMEEMPRPCFGGATSAGYAKKHNPFAYYDGISRHPARCRRIVPLGRLPRDLEVARLPDLIYIVPGLCNSTHDCIVRAGDDFLRRLVPTLLRVLGPHGFLVITYDEGGTRDGCCGGEASGGRIPTIVAGPEVRRGARVRRPYNHYSLLRTLTDAFGVPPLGHAASPLNPPFDDAFRRPPRL